MEAFEGLVFALHRGLGASLVAEVVAELVEVDLLKEHLEGFGTHLGDELVGVGVFEELVVTRERVEYCHVLFLCEEVELVDAIGLFYTRLNDDVALVVDNGIDFFCRNAEEATNLVWERAEVPDVGNGHNERDVTHALTADFLFGDLDTTTVADNAFVADAFVLTAMALIVLDRAEDALAEKAVTLRLVGTIVNGLGLKHLTARQIKNLFWGSQTDRDF